MKVKSYNTTIAELSKVELPIQTISYKPINHLSVIDSIKEQIDKKNIVISSEIYKSNSNGNQLTGEFRFKSNLDKDIDLSLIFQNSYDKSMSFKLVSGFWTYCCKNGQCYGDLGTFKRRHVGEIQSLTPINIIKQLDSVEQEFDKAIVLKNKLKETEITKRTVAELIGRLYHEQELLQTTQLSILKQEMDTPQFDYGVENTAWNLYSNITHSYKQLHPRLYIEQNSKLSNFFIEEFS